MPQLRNGLSTLIWQHKQQMLLTCASNIYHFHPNSLTVSLVTCKRHPPPSATDNTLHRVRLELACNFHASNSPSWGWRGTGVCNRGAWRCCSTGRYSWMTAWARHISVSLRRHCGHWPCRRGVQKGGQGRLNTSACTLHKLSSTEMPLQNIRAKLIRKLSSNMLVSSMSMQDLISAYMINMCEDMRIQGLTKLRKSQAMLVQW